MNGAALRKAIVKSAVLSMAITQSETSFVSVGRRMFMKAISAGLPLNKT